KERATDLPGEAVAFTETDALIALEVITKRKPQVVVLERLFASTPRGTALINRIKADPSLNASEIRVMAADGDYLRRGRRAPAARPPTAAPAPGEAPTPAPAPAATKASAAPVAAAPVVAVPAPAPAPAAVAAPAVAPLDQRGTRRAPRYKVSGSVEVLVDGSVASLIDLSIMGAQIVSPTILK